METRKLKEGEMEDFLAELENPSNPSNEFGNTLDEIDLANTIEEGRAYARDLYEDGGSFNTSAVLDYPSSIESLEDTYDTLRELWAKHAGAYLGRRNPTLTEHIAMYLEYGFHEEPSCQRAFAAWLDRIKEYGLRDWRKEEEGEELTEKSPES